jgi:hypothetical protein
MQTLWGRHSINSYVLTWTIFLQKKVVQFRSNLKSKLDLVEKLMKNETLGSFGVYTDLGMELHILEWERIKRVFDCLFNKDGYERLL